MTSPAIEGPHTVCPPCPTPPRVCRECGTPLDARGRNRTGLCRSCNGERISQAGADAEELRAIHRALKLARPALEAGQRALRVMECQDYAAQLAVLARIGGPS